MAWGGNLSIDTNASLTTLEGLRGVTIVSGYLYIANNGSLTTVEGLRNVEVIRNTGGCKSTSLDLVDNPLVTLGLPFPKLRVKNGDVYLGGTDGDPAPNAYVVAHLAALERVPRVECWCCSRSFLRNKRGGCF